jgi:hypothetical protein
MPRFVKMAQGISGPLAGGTAATLTYTSFPPTFKRLMTIAEYQSAAALINQEGVTLHSEPLGPNDVLLIAETATEQHRFESRDEVYSWWADYTPLTDDQLKKLWHLAAHTYLDQASRCHDAKAYLASCIMIGAAIEALLTWITNLLYSEAVNTTTAPKKGKKTRHLLDWRFFDLLNVAMELRWLPEELTLLNEPDFKGSVRTDSIREVRNLVHPARVLQDRAGKEYTEEELTILYATCLTVFSLVQDQLVKDICKYRPAFKFP